MPDSKLEKETEKQDQRDGDKDPNAKRDVEVGGRQGLDPTRFGDWEKNGRCIDF